MRKAVFLGDVSMGGRTYKTGDVVRMREQDVQALIDTGVVRWDGEKAKAVAARDPHIWALTVEKAASAIRLEKSAGRLRRWAKEEGRNPKHDGGRQGVLDAIEEQLALGA